MKFLLESLKINDIIVLRNGIERKVIDISFSGKYTLNRMPIFDILLLLGGWTNYIADGRFAEKPSQFDIVDIITYVPDESEPEKTYRKEESKPVSAIQRSILNNTYDYDKRNRSFGED